MLESSAIQHVVNVVNIARVMFDSSVHSSVATCANGDIRLVGGVSPLEGRVEVCWNKTWGTVCDGSWEVTDGNVACKQLGFSKLSRFLSHSQSSYVCIYSDVNKCFSSYCIKQ